jgi:hypothetical protein
MCNFSMNVSFDVVSMESNLPGEDRFQIIQTQDGISAFGVFDGHGGYLACDIAG